MGIYSSLFLQTGCTGPADQGHGHLRHLLPGRVPEAVGRKRPHRHHDPTASNLRDPHNDLKGSTPLNRFDLGALLSLSSSGPDFSHKY